MYPWIRDCGIGLGVMSVSLWFMRSHSTMFEFTAKTTQTILAPTMNL